MKKLICLIISLFYFSVLATEKKAEVAYLTERYKQITSLLSENLTIEQLAAELSLRTFDIRYFQDITQFAKERNIDSKKERILVRSNQNKLFVDGLKNPLIVANSPELKISYMGDEIPFSAKLSPLENLNRIEKFFSTHSGGTASAKWHNLIFGVPEARGVAIGPAIGALGVTILFSAIGGVAILNNLIPLFSDKNGARSKLFKSKNPLKALKISCESGSIAILESGKEKYSFKFIKNGPGPDGSLPKDQIEISYEQDMKKSGTISLSLELGDYGKKLATNSSSENPHLSQNLDELTSLVPLMTKEDSSRGNDFRQSICPMSDTDLTAWKAAIQAVQKGKYDGDINLPKELDKARSSTSQ